MRSTITISNIPKPKQTSDNLLIPIPIPDTVEIVAIPVTTHKIIS